MLGSMPTTLEILMDGQTPSFGLFQLWLLQELREWIMEYKSRDGSLLALILLLYIINEVKMVLILTFSSCLINERKTKKIEDYINKCWKQISKHINKTHYMFYLQIISFICKSILNSWELRISTILHNHSLKSIYFLNVFDILDFIWFINCHFKNTLF